MHSYSAEHSTINRTHFLNNQRDQKQNTCYVPYRTGAAITPHQELIVVSHYAQDPELNDATVFSQPRPDISQFVTDSIYDCGALSLVSLEEGIKLLIHAHGPTSLHFLIQEFAQLLPKLFIRNSEPRKTEFRLYYNPSKSINFIKYEALTSILLAKYNFRKKPSTWVNSKTAIHV
jgi:hypothetical protein